MNCTEIAQELNISRVAVLNIVKRALCKFYKRMRKKGFESQDIIISIAQHFNIENNEIEYRALVRSFPKIAIDEIKNKYRGEISEQTRINIYGKKRTIKKRPIILIHPNGKREKFSTIGEAAKKYNLSVSSLSAIANPKYLNKQTKGFKAIYDKV